MFIKISRGGDRVRPGSLSSLWYALGVSKVAGFIGVRPRGRRIHPVSLGSFGYALWDFGFICNRWIHWGASWWSLCSYGAASFIGMRPGSRWVRPKPLDSVHPKPLDSLRCALDSSGVIGVSSEGGRVHTVSLGSFG